MNYKDYIQTSQWKAKANAAKRLSGWSCALCDTTKSLEVHHKTYARLGHERMSDLVVLCWRCHRRHHHTLVSMRGHRYDQNQLALPFVASIPSGADLN